MEEGIVTADEGWHAIGQVNPVMLKPDGAVSFGGVQFGVLPAFGRPFVFANKVVKTTPVDSVLFGEGHVYFAQEAHEAEVGQPCFLEGFAQNGRFWLFVGRPCASGHLGACLRVVDVVEDEEATAVGDVGEYFVADFHAWGD